MLQATTVLLSPRWCIPFEKSTLPRKPFPFTKKHPKDRHRNKCCRDSQKAPFHKMLFLKENVKYALSSYSMIIILQYSNSELDICPKCCTLNVSSKTPHFISGCPKAINKSQNYS